MPHELDLEPVAGLVAQVAERQGGPALVIEPGADDPGGLGSATVLHLRDADDEDVSQRLEHPRAASVPIIATRSLGLEIDPAPDAEESAAASVVLAGLCEAVERAGRIVDMAGFAPSSRTQRLRDTAVVAASPAAGPAFTDPPPDFRVLALICAYNEEDVIGPCIAGLVEEGVEVYVMDNWSTDATLEIAESWIGHGVTGVERFPSDGPTDTFDLAAVLARQEELAAASNADWCVHHDADERRRSPWPGTRMREALWYVQQAGFNAVDHTNLEFRPTDDDYEPGTDFAAHLLYYDEPKTPRRVPRRNVWRNNGERVDLQGTAGHAVKFHNMKVYPYNFVYQHYPIRSQRHGERKVLAERLPRYAEEGRRRGWHRHYEGIAPGESFLWDPTDLERFDHATFVRRRLVEAAADIWPLDRRATVAQARRGRLARALNRRGLLAPALKLRRAIRPRRV